MHWHAAGTRASSFSIALLRRYRARVRRAVFSIKRIGPITIERSIDLPMSTTVNAATETAVERLHLDARLPIRDHDRAQHHLV